jgi:hypothetical protein
MIINMIEEFNDKYTFLSDKFVALQTELQSDNENEESSDH